MSIQASRGLCITKYDDLKLAEDAYNVNDTIIPVELFLASNILLYAIAIEKE
jgi:hypothetical protein